MATRPVQDSVQVEWRPGRFIRLMDPFDALESRVQNAVGLLEDKGPHVLTQAAWGIEVAKAALVKLAGQPQEGARLGRKVQGIFQLADSQPGKRLLRAHGIEVLDAIDVPALPAHAKQLDKVEALAARRSALRTACRSIA